MYKKIMIPVDLAHTDRLEKALTTAADLSKQYGIPVCYTAVTASTPTSVAHTPEEFAQKLEAFAQSENQKLGLHSAESHTIVDPDPVADLGKKLIKAAHEQGCDLVVMASHVPGIQEHIFESNAGKMALHADVSVFVVR
ncbi:universal stress protein UspA [Rhodovibrio sodomensis]|uniref:Universal stress protein UspA n=1 Tax=Rhodovibrio sodomensis TaxID=1088 RepID=A0ABS1DCB1_9PROT|nr:universal stress protein [Rhodovibrio sodomensis]MBK1667534.1 universal stress protein UspA [Rhodovibrio sodomensis]